MSSRDTDQNELGAFLRVRRSELSPSDVNLPEGGPSGESRIFGARRSPQQALRELAWWVAEHIRS